MNGQRSLAHARPGGLPCLDLLEATPAVLRGLMSETSDEDAR